MALTGLLTFVVLGLTLGWNTIPVAFWALLIPFAVRDILANKHNDKVEALAGAVIKLIEAKISETSGASDGSVESAIDEAISHAQRAKTDRPGLQMGMMGLSLNQAQHDEIQSRADKQGKTFEEMMVELIAQRMRARGGSLADAKIVGHYGPNGEEIE